ncbi:MAG: sulfite exporter TauE/SafE family protein [Lachnospiraceae bacterium]|nr:sulfite exporter TauE/SafE family protein [Lachnospiraceae bacterium]
MKFLVIILVCFFSSIVGSICGIGGGVIIKPVLDATGLMPVTTISFLSGCTVLSMSFVSLYKNLKAPGDSSFDRVFASVLAFGAVIGGILGKDLYQDLIGKLPNTDGVGAVQSAVLAVITLGTLVYTLFKKRIPTRRISNKLTVLLIGIFLGVLSSFLGIGGGPVNLVALSYFFSMAAKQSAMYSIYTILFSQISSLLFTLWKGTVPPFQLPMLLLMILCGIFGGYAGSKINRRLDDHMVDKLFTGIMSLIIGICFSNILRYL